jgi:DNA repair protein RecO (recombination protein O)
VSLVRGTAIVLRIRDYSESDLIVTLFTETWGKRSMIAKGARGLRSRFGGVFDLLNQVEVVFYEKSRLDFVGQAALLEPHLTLKAHLESVTAALAVARLLERFLPLHQQEDRAYSLFSRFLALAEAGGLPADQLSLATTLKLLSILGHRPALRACGRCQRRDGPFTFVPAEGGLRCEACRPGSGIPVTLGLARSLDTLLNAPLDRVGRLRLSPEDAQSARTLLAAYADYLVAGP